MAAYGRASRRATARILATTDAARLIEDLANAGPVVDRIVAAVSVLAAQLAERPAAAEVLAALHAGVAPVATREVRTASRSAAARARTDLDRALSNVSADDLALDGIRL